MEPSLMDAIQKQTEYNAKLKKAKMSRGTFMQVVRGRPSIAKDVQLARQVANGITESFYWVGTELQCKTGSSYIDFSANAGKFPLWEVSEGTGGTLGTNQANVNNLDIILWVGLQVNWDIQAATLEELCQLGLVTISYGEQTRPDRTLPLMDFIVHPSRILYDLDTDAAVEKAVEPSTYEGGFTFDRNEPMVVKGMDSRPVLTISGLSGTIAGSTPLLRMTLCVRGIRVRF